MSKEEIITKFKGNLIDYIDKLQQENQKYKEVIYKAIEYINGILTEAYLDESADIDIGLIEYAVDILKEVE